MFAYPRIVFGCGSGVALLYVPLDTFKTCNAIDIFRIVRNTAADPVLALVAMRLLTEIYWNALEDQEWLLFNDDKEKIIMVPAEPSLA